VNEHDAWVADSFRGDDDEEAQAWAEYDEQLQQLIEDDEYEALWLECAEAWTGLEPSGRIYGKGNAMTQKLNLEKALKDLQRQQEAVSKLLKQTQRFPEEFPVGTVLKFRHVFENSVVVRNMRASGIEPVAYEYAALHADNGWWYLTCASTKRMLWDELIDFIGDEEVTMMVEGEKV